MAGEQEKKKKNGTKQGKTSGEKQSTKSEKSSCCGRACGVVCAVLSAAAGTGWYHQQQITNGFTAFGLGGYRSLLWMEALDIIRSRSLQSPKPQRWFFASEPGESWRWVANIRSFKAVFGINFVHGSVIPGIDYRGWLYPWDRESRMCQSLLNYMWSHPNTSTFTYPSIYAGYAEVSEWVRACKAEWPNLGGEEKTLLAGFRDSGHIPLDVLMPPVEDTEQNREEARRQKDLPLWENTERYTREELEDIVRESIKWSTWSWLVGSEPPKKAIDYYMSMNMRKTMEIPGTWEAVSKAIRAGQITKFDATGLLPKELFNVSFETMRDWEGPNSYRIPIFGDARMPSDFYHFVEARKPWMTEATNRAGHSFADLDAQTVSDKNRSTYSQADRIRVFQATPIVPAGYIHAKRLPEFHKKLPNVEKLMSIEDDVLRGQSMLWCGATPGGFHFDEEANVYIQLSGHTSVFMVPQNWTAYFTGAVRHPWGSQGLPGFHEVEQEPRFKKIPIYLMNLKPGDGVTLHGRAYHRFIGQTNDRIALNWFFVPKWRKMEYTPADWYSIEASRSLTRLALRQLWARTVARVFDDSGRGLIYMGTKLEYL